MFTKLLSIITGLPSGVKIGIVAFLILSGIETKHVLQVRSLQGQIVELKNGLNLEKANELTLVTSVNQQNAKITQMGLDSQKAQDAAVKRALSRVKVGKKVSEDLKSKSSPIPPGFPEMNKWLSEEFQ